MKSKKIIASLMALSIIGASSLTFGGTAKAATLKSNVKATNTINLSQNIKANVKGFNYDVNKDMYGNVHVTIKPEDYRNHNYKVIVSFEDSSRKILSRIQDSNNTLVYQHAYGGPDNWTRADAILYADGDFLGDVAIYY